MNALKMTLIAAAGVAIAAPALAESEFKPNAPESFYALEAYGNGTYPNLVVVNEQYHQATHGGQQSSTLTESPQMALQVDEGLRAGRTGDGPLTTDPKNTVQ